MLQEEAVVLHALVTVRRVEIERAVEIKRVDRPSTIIGRHVEKQSLLASLGTLTSQSRPQALYTSLRTTNARLFPRLDITIIAIAVVAAPDNTPIPALHAAISKLLTELRAR